MDGKRHMHGSFTFRIKQGENGSLIASFVKENKPGEKDDVGALYYVIVVILIYGCSILMMIASYIRKNKLDRKMNRYIKEMANVRKRQQQLQLFNAAAKAAASKAPENPCTTHQNIVNKSSNTISQCSATSQDSPVPTPEMKAPSPSVFIFPEPGLESRAETLLSYSSQKDALVPMTPAGYLSSNTDSDNDYSENDIKEASNSEIQDVPSVEVTLFKHGDDSLEYPPEFMFIDSPENKSLQVVSTV